MASKPPPSSTAAAGTAVGSTQPLLHDSPADDVANPKFAAAALDFLLIELVPLAQRLTDQLLARDAQLVAEHSQSRMFATPASTTAETAESTSADGEVATAMTSLGFPVVGEETREGMMRRLDGLGYRVGQGLVERYVFEQHLTPPPSRLTDSPAPPGEF
nr:hypothetical protein CFP56_78397 [Quercus suber]